MYMRYLLVSIAVYRVLRIIFFHYSGVSTWNNTNPDVTCQNVKKCAYFQNKVQITCYLINYVFDFDFVVYIMNC